MNQQDQDQQQPQKVYAVTASKSGMAIAGLVLGIIALLTSFVPFVNNISFFLALLGIIFAIIGFVGIAKGKKSGKGLAIAALIICVLSCGIVLASQSAYSDALNSASSSTTVSSGSDAQTDSENTASDAAQKADFTVSDEKLNVDTYNATITGTVTNVSDQDKNYVGVTYNLYDKDGNLIGNANDGANGLKAGATWKFEAYASVSDPKQIATFERGDMTSW